MNNHLVWKGLLLLLLSSGCVSNGKLTTQLTNHFKNLNTAASGKITPAEKFDILAESLVVLMDESLKISTRKGIRYINKYTKQNEKAINQITNDFVKWQRELPILEKAAFAIGLANKSYINEFVALTPKFKQRYNKMRFLLNVLSKLNNAI